MNSRCSGFINICYSDQLLGYKTSFTQWGKKRQKRQKKKKKTHTKLKCTQIHLFPFNGFIWQVYIFIAILLFSSWITNSPCLLLTLPATIIWPRWKMGEVDRLPYKSLLQIVDVPIQYMFRYTNSDERCKRLAEEETISFSSLVTAAAFLRTAHVKEYQLGGRLA